MKRLGRGARALTATALAVMSIGTLSACGGHMSGSGAGDTTMAGMDHSGHGSGMGSMATMSDAMFVEMMVPHHRMAIEMADIQLRRGKEPRVEVLAQKIKDAQQPEIDAMTALFEKLTGKTLDTSTVMLPEQMATMGMSMDMSELETTPEPDRVFLRLMIPHHAGAIVMADLIAQRSSNDTIVKMARQMVADQSAEIGRMQTLRAKLAPPIG